MEWTLGILVIVALMALRLAVPLSIIATLGYLLRRLDNRWHPAIVGGGE